MESFSLLNHLALVLHAANLLCEMKQVWHLPYEAPGIVDSGLYAITIVCGPKDMSQEKYILIWQKI